MRSSIRNLLLLVLLLGGSAALAEPASEASVRRLLEVTQARALLQQVQQQAQDMMQGLAQQSLRGKSPTPAQEAAITRMTTRMVALIQEQLSWERQEPMYMRLYTQTFTEDEVAGMLAFYETPAGRATIEKMPLVLRQISQESQRSMAEMGAQLKAIQRDFVAEMQAAIGKP